MSTRSSIQRSGIGLKQSGQATLEYVLMLGIAIAISIGIYSGFYSTLRTGFKNLNAELEKSLQTGNFEENVNGWDNSYQ